MTAESPIDIERPELAAFRPVLERLRIDGARFLGVPSPRLEVERHMPRFYSDVVKLVVWNGTRSSRIYVKIAKLPAGHSEAAMAARIETIFETMTHLHQSMAGIPGLSAVKPIACFPAHLAIVTEEAPGEILLDLLERQAAWWPSAETLERLASSLRRVGEWLRHFHQVSIPNRDRLDVAAMRDYLDVRLRLLANTHRVLSPAGRERLLEAFDARASRLRQSDRVLVPVHADFAPGNIVIDGANVAVLDFSVPAYGAICHDVAHLHLQLDLLTSKPTFRPSAVGILQQALLDGFSPGLETAQPLFELLSLQHTACHLTGLAQNPARPVARVYNRLLIRRHLRWLSEFAGGDAAMRRQ